VARYTGRVSEGEDKYVIVHEIPVVRETYCSQQVADKAIRHVLTSKPDLVYELLMEEHGRQHDYSEAAWDILEYLEQEHVEVPTTYLGRMDLISELSRRLCRAYGRPDPLPRGHAIAQPMPPLPRLELCEHTRKYAHVTQELVDGILQRIYERRPDLWFAVAEEYRYYVLLDATTEFGRMIEEIASTEFPEQRNLWTMMDVRLEGVRRMYQMCGIEVPD